MPVKDSYCIARILIGKTVFTVHFILPFNRLPNRCRRPHLQHPSAQRLPRYPHCSTRQSPARFLLRHRSSQGQKAGCTLLTAYSAVQSEVAQHEQSYRQVRTPQLVTRFSSDSRHPPPVVTTEVACDEDRKVWKASALLRLPMVSVKRGSFCSPPRYLVWLLLPTVSVYQEMHIHRIHRAGQSRKAYSNRRRSPSSGEDEDPQDCR